MKIVSIVGSLRQDSWNHRLARAAAKVLKEKGVDVEEASLAELTLFNGDLDDGTFPAPVAVLREAMQSADGLLIACPEYNHSHTGGYEERNRVDVPPTQLLDGQGGLRHGNYAGPVGGHTDAPAPVGLSAVRGGVG